MIMRRHCSLTNIGLIFGFLTPLSPLVAIFFNLNYITWSIDLLLGL